MYMDSVHHPRFVGIQDASDVEKDQRPVDAVHAFARAKSMTRRAELRALEPELSTYFDCMEAATEIVSH